MEKKSDSTIQRNGEKLSSRLNLIVNNIKKIKKFRLSMKMKEFQNIHFTYRKDFRNWLEKNYDNYRGLWLIFYKKGTGIKSISYDEAVEEALCFGWIDSIIKRIDDEKYVRKFTPRTNTANWSVSNKNRVIKLIEEGKMTNIGLSKIDLFLTTGKVDWVFEKVPKSKTLNIPEFIINELSKNEPASQNFNNLSPSYKRQYIDWITSAKRKETIEKRLNESVELLMANKKLYLK